MLVKSKRKKAAAYEFQYGVSQNISKPLPNHYPPYQVLARTTTWILRVTNCVILRTAWRVETGCPEMPLPNPARGLTDRKESGSTKTKTRASHSASDIRNISSPSSQPPKKLDFRFFLSRATRLYTPLCRSVRRSVRSLVRHTLLFWGFCGIWPHCSCPNDQVTSKTAPVHPHATGVAVYPALFL